MAQSYIDALVGDFEPEEYTDEYADALRALVEAKAAGRELVAPSEPAARGGDVIDLMAALEASVAQARKGRPAEKPARKPAEKAPATRKAAPRAAAKTTKATGTKAAAKTATKAAAKKTATKTAATKTATKNTAKATPAKRAATRRSA